MPVLTLPSLTSTILPVMRTPEPVAALSLLSLLGLMLVQSLLVPSTTSAIPQEATWFEVDIPAVGESGGWVLADGAAIIFAIIE